jgi:hypothetical protein
MTEGVTGRHWNLPPAARSTSTPSLSTSPATGASIGSPSRGGWSLQRVGGLESAAPSTASVGRPDEAGLSAPRERPSHRAPRGGGPPAGLLGRGELLIASSSPHSSRVRLSVAVVMMILLWHGEATTWMTPTCHSNPLPCWPCHCSMTALAVDLRWRSRRAPPPSAS